MSPTPSLPHRLPELPDDGSQPRASIVSSLRELAEPLPPILGLGALTWTCLPACPRPGSQNLGGWRRTKAGEPYNDGQQGRPGPGLSRAEPSQRPLPLLLASWQNSPGDPFRGHCPAQPSQTLPSKAKDTTLPLAPLLAHPSQVPWGIRGARSDRVLEGVLGGHQEVAASLWTWTRAAPTPTPAGDPHPSWTTAFSGLKEAGDTACLPLSVTSGFPFLSALESWGSHGRQRLPWDLQRSCAFQRGRRRHPEALILRNSQQNRRAREDIRPQSDWPRPPQGLVTATTERPQLPARGGAVPAGTSGSC